MEVKNYENCVVIDATSKVKANDDEVTKTICLYLKDKSGNTFWSWYRFSEFTRNLANAISPRQEKSIMQFNKLRRLDDDVFVKDVFIGATISNVEEKHYLENDICFFTEVDDEGNAKDNAKTCDHEFSLYEFSGMKLDEDGLKAIAKAISNKELSDQLKVAVTNYKMIVGETLDDDRLATFAKDAIIEMLKR